MVKLLDSQAKKEIVTAIVEAEKQTSGEIRVHVKAHCRGQALEEAKKIFSRLGMHRTRRRNGVLIFVAFQSKKFAILGDEGIHRHAGDSFWNQTRDAMASHFSKGRFREGVVAGVRSVGGKLARHFPADQRKIDELLDTVTES